MIRRLSLCGGLLVLALGAPLTPLISPPAFATTVVAMDLETLSRQADCVFEGTVLDVRSEWNSQRTQIYTLVDFDIRNVLGGLCAIGPRQLRILGGGVADTAMIVNGAPSFAEGEQVTVFFSNEPELLVPIVGLQQGVLRETVDPQTGATRVGNRFVGNFDRADLATRIREAREGK